MILKKWVLGKFNRKLYRNFRVNGYILLFWEKNEKRLNLEEILREINDILMKKLILLGKKNFGEKIKEKYDR